jgi:hypothetical protein
VLTPRLMNQCKQFALHLLGLVGLLAQGTYVTAPNGRDSVSMRFYYRCEEFIFTLEIIAMMFHLPEISVMLFFSLKGTMRDPGVFEERVTVCCYASSHIISLKKPFMFTAPYMYSLKISKILNNWFLPQLPTIRYHHWNSSPPRLTSNLFNRSYNIHSRYNFSKNNMLSV